MENEKNSKIIAIIALCVGVVGLAVGFAAFSSTLTINSGASAKPDPSTFSVVFSKVAEALDENNIIPALTPTTLTAQPGVINNEGSPKLTGINVEFTEPGQKAVYTFYARNEGEYVAYLNSINIAKVTGKEVTKVCVGTADEEGKMPTDALVQAACDDITLSIKVGSLTETLETVSDITGHTVARKGSKNASDALIDYEPIIVTINYAPNGDRADGNFAVTFGDITLNYGSAD